MNHLQVFEGTGFMVEFHGFVVALGCPRKLGSMLTKWVFVHLPINGIYWGYNLQPTY